MLKSTGLCILFVMIPGMLSFSSQQGPPDATVDFGNRIRDWDGFGVNYVEVRHTRDYDVWPQDYGGFSYLSDTQKMEMIDLVFGADGLQPNLAKMFLCAYHEQTPDNDDPYDINMAGFEHEKYTRHMRWFIREGLRRTRSLGGDLMILAGLYVGPGWTIKQGDWGRDLNPEMKYELAEYMISWAKYLRETERFPVRYISLHNEEELPKGYRKDGYAVWHDDHSLDSRRDRAPWWPKEQIVDFLTFMPDMIRHHGLNDVGLTNGETNRWKWFAHEESIGSIASAIAADDAAVRGLGLITSHGFMRVDDGDYSPEGVEMIRAKRPELHAWTTSCNWGMRNRSDVNFIHGFQRQIYHTGVNGIIPWATTFCEAESGRTTWGKSYKSSNTNTPFHVYHDCTYEVRKSYYYYKHLTRAGRAGMAVAHVAAADQDMELIAFARKNIAGDDSGHPDAFILANTAAARKHVAINVLGSSHPQFDAYLNTEEGDGEKNYEKDTSAFRVTSGRIVYDAPAKSVTTFIAREK